jgi:hypothetical protein
LVVVRRDMDLDNLAPVAWRLAASGRAEVILLSMNGGLNAAADSRVAFLARQAGVTTGNLYRAYAPGWRHRLASPLIGDADDERAASWRGRLASRFGTARLYDEAWCEGLLRHYGITHIVMDWTKAQTGACGALTAAGRRLGIPSFALPHGVDTLNRSDYFVEPLRRANHFRHFDYIVTPNRIRRDFLMAGGFPAERIAVLGSARFSPVWERVLSRIVATDSRALPNDGRLNVVWFDKPGARCSPVELSVLLNRVARLPDVRLAVKGKPGSKLSYDPATLSRDVVDGSDIASFALCQWANVLAGLPSGILLEAFVMQRELVLLRGLDLLGACEPYQEPPVCWLADDDDGFVSALETIRAGSSERPYRRGDVASFVGRLLFPNESPESVLDAYVDFILGAESRRAARQTDLALAVAPAH